MSQIITDTLLSSSTRLEDGSADDQRRLDQLDLYLAIMKTNRLSNRFVPDDALMALDMAGFVRGCLTGEKSKSAISTARMALALVQGVNKTPVH